MTVVRNVQKQSARVLLTSPVTCEPTVTAIVTTMTDSLLCELLFIWQFYVGFYFTILASVRLLYWED